MLKLTYVTTDICAKVRKIMCRIYKNKSTLLLKNVKTKMVQTGS